MTIALRSIIFFFFLYWCLLYLIIIIIIMIIIITSHRIEIFHFNSTAFKMFATVIRSNIYQMRNCPYFFFFVYNWFIFLSYLQEFKSLFLFSHVFQNLHKCSTYVSSIGMEYVRFVSLLLLVLFLFFFCRLNYSAAFTHFHLMLQEYWIWRKLFHCLLVKRHFSDMPNACCEMLWRHCIFYVPFKFL